MKNTRVFSLDTTLLFIVSILMLFTLALSGCATKPKNIIGVDRAADINAEVEKTRKEINIEKDGNLHLLSPSNFSKLEKYLSSAEDDIRKKKVSDDTFVDLEIARAWLNQAREVGPLSREQLAKPLQARSYAAAVADNNNNELFEIDEETIDLGKRIENKNDISENERIRLANHYTDVEKKRLERVYLNPIENRIEQAKDNKAARLTPKTLKTTEQDFKAAEDTLKIVPFNRAQFLQRVKVADKSSRDLLEISQQAVNTSSRSFEDLVLQQREERRKIDEEISNSQQGQANLAAQRKELQSQVAELKQKAQPQVLLTTLKEELPPDKADIALNSNGEVMIRLKDLQFKSNSADLTPQAAVVLSDVKSALSGIEPSRLRIDGHTDATGPAEVNKHLSESRAESVAQFLKNDGTLKGAEFQIEGFGAEKPLKNNRTKQGRAENRRVEIFIANESMGEAL